MSNSWWEEAERPAQPSKRRYMLWQSVFFSIAAVVCLGFVIYALINIVGGETGYIVMLVVFGLFTFVTASLAIPYLRDLNRQPVVAEGEITRRWAKGNLFFFLMHSHYIAVEGRIYTITRADYVHLYEGDVVKLSHYPNSLTVEIIELYDTGEKKFVPIRRGAEP